MLFHPSLRRRVAVSILSLCLPLVLGAADLPGISNFQKLNDHVYRGAQPTELGFQSLAKLGVKIVVDLRLIGEHSQADEQRMVESNGMKYVSVPMRGMHTPTDEQVSKVLALLDDTTIGPVFVHCKRGADRTGAVIACYRVEHDHWKNDQALHEARSLGMSWYQRALQKYVTRYQAPETVASTPAVAAPAAGAPVAAEPVAVTQ
jgi:tyrosine-protein phosphatase SIW14